MAVRLAAGAAHAMLRTVHKIGTLERIMDTHTYHARQRLMVGFIAGTTALAIVAVTTVAALSAPPNVVSPPVTPPDVTAPNITSPDATPTFVVPPAYRYYTADRDAYLRVVGRARMLQELNELADEPAEPTREPREPETDIPQTGVVPIDENDADNDGYVEYYDQGHYVAELRNLPENDDTESDAADARVTFTGKIMAHEVIQMDKREKPHLVVRLQDTEGKHSLVDLGLASQYDKAALKANDSLWISSHLGTINGQAALIADQVRVGEKAKMTVKR
jgi:hypothetical protein